MKESTSKHVLVELEEAEIEAFELVLETLERITYIYDEEEVNAIYSIDERNHEFKILEGTADRAIQALEEIRGVWS